MKKILTLILLLISFNLFSQNKSVPFYNYTSLATSPLYPSLQVKNDSIFFWNMSIWSLVGKTNTSGDTVKWNAKMDSIRVNTLLTGKQATLVSGSNIKTVNSTSLLGSGNITTLILNDTTGGTGNLVATKHYVDTHSSSITIASPANGLKYTGGVLSDSLVGPTNNGALSKVDYIKFSAKMDSIRVNTLLTGKQATLVSGSNIKTVNSTSLLGSGNIAVGSGTVTSITIGTGLMSTQSPLTTTGTIALDTNYYKTNKGTNNTFIGYHVGIKNSSSGSVGIGDYSLSGLLSNTATAFGYYALKSNTSGAYNTAIGYQSLQNNTTGGQNTSVGYNSLSDNSIGYYNTAFGYYALKKTTTADNTGIGYYSNANNTTGIYNTSLGFQSLSANTINSYNIALGAYAGQYSDLSNRLYINSLDRNNVSGDSTESIIYGIQNTNVSNQRLVLNAKVLLPYQVYTLNDSDNVAITFSKLKSYMSSHSGRSMVYPGAGIANSTGSAWGTSYGTTGSGNVVLAGSPTITSPNIARIGNLTSDSILKTKNANGTLTYAKPGVDYQAPLTNPVVQADSTIKYFTPTQAKLKVNKADSGVFNGGYESKFAARFLDATSSVQTQLNGKQASLGFTPVANTTTVNGHALSSNVTVTTTDLSLNNLTNDKQVKVADSSILPLGYESKYAASLLAPKASPTFTGTVTIPSPFTLGSTSVTTTGTQLNYLNGTTGTTGTNKVVLSTAPTINGTANFTDTIKSNSAPIYIRKQFGASDNPAMLLIDDYNAAQNAFIWKYRYPKPILGTFQPYLTLNRNMSEGINLPHSNEADFTYNLGLNEGTGAPIETIDSTHGGIGINFECLYWNGAKAGQEWHINHQYKGTYGSNRPVTFLGVEDGTSETLLFNLHGCTWTNPTTGNPLLSMNLVNHQLVLNDTAVFVFNRKNYYPFVQSQLNGTGRNLMGLVGDTMALNGGSFRMFNGGLWGFTALGTSTAPVGDVNGLALYVPGSDALRMVTKNYDVSNPLSMGVDSMGLYVRQTTTNNKILRICRKAPDASIYIDQSGNIGFGQYIANYKAVFNGNANTSAGIAINGMTKSGSTGVYLSGTITGNNNPIYSTYSCSTGSVWLAANTSTSSSADIRYEMTANASGGAVVQRMTRGTADYSWGINRTTSMLQFGVGGTLSSSTPLILFTPKTYKVGIRDTVRAWFNANNANQFIIGSGSAASAGNIMLQTGSGSVLQKTKLAVTSTGCVILGDSAGSHFTKVDSIGGLKTPSIVVTGTISGKHLIGTTAAPTGAVGTGAGTSPSAVTFSANANDLDGQVLVTTGTLPTASATVLTMTFNTAFGTAPIVMIQPANAATALLTGISSVYISATSTTTATFTVGATGLVASTAYAWNYFIHQ